MKKMLSFLLVTVLGVSLMGCGNNKQAEQPANSPAPEQQAEAGDTKIDVSRMRVVIGSTSAGGDTYQNAELISRYVEQIGGVNAKVDAIGANRAFDEMLKAKNDGSTVMFFHDMTYLGVEYGSYDKKYDLENYTVGPMVAANPGNVFLAKHDAPFNTMAESAEWLKNNQDKTITVAIEAGGVSELSFDGYYLWVKEQYGEEVSKRIKAYVTGSQKDKDQALWDGNVDIIHGSIASNVQYTDQGVEDKIRMKFLGVTSPERIEEFKDIPTFKEQGIDFVFEKEYFFILPKDVDPNFVKALDNVVAESLKDPEYEKSLKVNAFTLNHKPSEEAAKYIAEKRATIQDIVKRAPKLDELTN